MYIFFFWLAVIPLVTTPFPLSRRLPRPHSVVSDDSDGEGGGPGGSMAGHGAASAQQDDVDSHGDRNSPISLIINRGEDKDDKGKDESRDDKEAKEDLDVTNDDSRVSASECLGLRRSRPAIDLTSNWN